MEFRQIIRNLVLSETDRFVLAVGKLQLFPKEIVSAYVYKNMPQHAHLEFTTQFTLDPITINIDGFDVAWLQELFLDTEKMQLNIGHFALDTKLVELGLGKKLLHAVKEVAKEELGISQILFKERSANPKYPGFFTEIIGAKEVAAFPVGTDWLWEFS